MTLDFVTVDVFTSAQFAGNPLAVVLNARGLSAAQMQAIAGEFNLSETTFVLPPKDPAHTAQVRIFTPRYEMPFAGHPNVGTAFVLAQQGTSYGRAVPADRIVFEEAAGLVPIDLVKNLDVVTGARLAAPQPLSIGADVSVALVAAACGLREEDVATHQHQPCIASCGAAFVLAEVTSRETLAQAAGRADVFARDVAKLPATAIMIYTRVAEPEIDIRARMFSPLHNIPEDPATGSANVALAGLLAHLSPERDLVLRKRVMQGFEMGRPSLLQVEARKRDGIVTDTFVGGHCVAVMNGQLTIR